jgi:DNA repair exonuclease SbcCD ATPase subunit
MNMDLRVENETLKKEIDEKNELLKRANDALESLEVERLRDQGEYESQMPSLKQSIIDTQWMSQVSQPGNSRSKAESEELHQELEAKIQEANQEHENNHRLRLELEQLQIVLREKSEELHVASDAMVEHQERIVELEAIVNKNTGLQDDVDRLQEKLKCYEEESVRANIHINKLDSEMRELQDKFDANQAEGGQIKELKDKLRSNEIVANEAQEEIAKTGEMMKQLMESNFDYQQKLTQLEKDLKIRQVAFEKLKSEYEVAKSKVREYRAHKSSVLSNKSQDEMLPSAATKHAGAPKPKSDAVDTEQIIQTDLKAYRAEIAKRAANKALEKAKATYADAIETYSSSVRDVVDVLRQRLVELVEFMQRLILMDGSALNNSHMTEDFRDALQRSINESRRLSVSLSQSMLLSADDPNETQASDSALPTLPVFKFPEIDVTFLDSAESFAQKTIECESLFGKLHENVHAREAVEQELVEVKRQLQEMALKEKQTGSELEDNVRARLAAEAQVEQMRVSLEKQQREGKENASVLEQLRESLQAHDETKREVETLKDALKRQGCDCEARIKKLENVLGETRTLLKESEEKSGQGKSCDCPQRIATLERLLDEARALLKDTQDKLRAEAERKEKMERAVRGQVVLTKKVLKKTALTSVENRL